MDQVQAAPAAPTQAPPSGFLSSEFILTLIGVIGAAWAGLADKLPPQTAAIIATVAIGMYCIARTGLKMAHALGYAKAFPDLPVLPFGSAAKQGGFAVLPLLLVLACAAVIVGCAIKPADPAQAVYEANGDFAAALDVANAYKSLPVCGSAGASAVCSQPAVVARVQAAANCAASVLAIAQAKVRGLTAPVMVNCSDPATAAAVSSIGSLDVAGIAALAKQVVASMASLTATLATK